jgi:hypothetical protein
MQPRIHSSLAAAFRRAAIVLPLLAAWGAPALHASTVINYSVGVLGTTGGGDTLYRYTYTLSGIAFMQNQELDIEFDPTVVGELSNGVSPAGFDLLLLQPNDPTGAPGEYSLLALVNNPSLAGTFSVDFTFHGPGVPGIQQFFLFDDSQVPAVQIEMGNTSAAVTGATPEPWSLVLCLAGLAAMGGGRAMRRRPGRKVIRQSLL